MAGMSGVPYRLFSLYDGIGAVLWAALGVATGRVFAREVTPLADRLEDTRAVVIYLGITGLLLFVLIKYLVRRRHGRTAIRNAN